ncbi:MAG: hypothetical protein L0338_05790, partial [Acidobacteria bacterium]|nr:hypothetical protein [Acidobacteriota bacterium]
MKKPLFERSPVIPAKAGIWRLDIFPGLSHGFSVVVSAVCVEPSPNKGFAGGTHGLDTKRAFDAATLGARASRQASRPPRSG